MQEFLWYACFEVSPRHTLTHFHWVLPDCFPEYLYQFILLPHILAKLMCITHSKFCPSDGCKNVYHFCFNVLFIYLLVRLSTSSLFVSPLVFPYFKFPIHIFHLVFYSVSSFIPSDLQEPFVYSSLNVL